MNRLWLGKGNPAASASSGCRCPWMPNKDQLYGNLCTHQPASSLAGESGIGFNLRKEMSEGERRWEKCLFKRSFAARLLIPWRCLR